MSHALSLLHGWEERGVTRHMFWGHADMGTLTGLPQPGYCIIENLPVSLNFSVFGKGIFWTPSQNLQQKGTGTAGFQKLYWRSTVALWEHLGI